MNSGAGGHPGKDKDKGNGLILPRPIASISTTALPPPRFSPGQPLDRQNISPLKHSLPSSSSAKPPTKRQKSASTPIPAKSDSIATSLLATQFTNALLEALVVHFLPVVPPTGWTGTTQQWTKLRDEEVAWWRNPKGILGGIPIPEDGILTDAHKVDLEFRIVSYRVKHGIPRLTLDHIPPPILDQPSSLATVTKPEEIDELEEEEPIAPARAQPTRPTLTTEDARRPSWRQESAGCIVIEDSPEPEDVKPGTAPSPLRSTASPPPPPASRVARAEAREEERRDKTPVRVPLDRSLFLDPVERGPTTSGAYNPPPLSTTTPTSSSITTPSPSIPPFRPSLSISQPQRSVISIPKFKPRLSLNHQSQLSISSLPPSTTPPAPSQIVYGSATSASPRLQFASLPPPPQPAVRLLPTQTQTQNATPPPSAITTEFHIYDPSREKQTRPSSNPPPTLGKIRRSSQPQDSLSSSGYLLSPIAPDGFATNQLQKMVQPRPLPQPSRTNEPTISRREMEKALASLRKAGRANSSGEIRPPQAPPMGQSSASVQEVSHRRQSSGEARDTATQPLSSSGYARLPTAQNSVQYQRRPMSAHGSDAHSRASTESHSLAGLGVSAQEALEYQAQVMTRHQSRRSIPSMSISPQNSPTVASSGAFGGSVQHQSTSTAIPTAPLSYVQIRSHLEDLMKVRDYHTRWTLAFKQVPPGGAPITEELRQSLIMLEDGHREFQTKCQGFISLHGEAKVAADILYYRGRGVELPIPIPIPTFDPPPPPQRSAPIPQLSKSDPRVANTAGYIIHIDNIKSYLRDFSSMKHHHKQWILADRDLKAGVDTSRQAEIQKWSKVSESQFHEYQSRSTDFERRWGRVKIDADVAYYRSVGALSPSPDSRPIAPQPLPLPLPPHPPPPERRPSTQSTLRSPLLQKIKNWSLPTGPLLGWSILPRVDVPEPQDFCHEGIPLMLGFAETVWVALEFATTGEEQQHVCRLAIGYGRERRWWTADAVGTRRSWEIAKVLVQHWQASIHLPSNVGNESSQSKGQRSGPAQGPSSNMTANNFPQHSQHSQSTAPRPPSNQGPPSRSAQSLPASTSTQAAPRTTPHSISMPGPPLSRSAPPTSNSRSPVFLYHTQSMAPRPVSTQGPLPATSSQSPTSVRSANLAASPPLSSRQGPQSNRSGPPENTYLVSDLVANVPAAAVAQSQQPLSAPPPFASSNSLPSSSTPNPNPAPPPPPPAPAPIDPERERVNLLEKNFTDIFSQPALVEAMQTFNQFQPKMSEVLEAFWNSEREKNTAWNEYANVLYLDQPAGTGYSYVTKHDDVRELAEAAGQVVNFLANLYQVFPEFIHMDTYIAGESYAGQYIPYIADAITKTTIIKTRLKGLMIGNGWISPREQYPAYLEYLVKRNLVKEGSAAHDRIQKKVDGCMKEIARMDERQEGSKGMILIGVCEEILGAIGAATKNEDGECLNLYNTTQYHNCGEEWPTQLRQVTPYLRRPDVVTALHAEGSRPRLWEQCSNEVGSHFWTPNSVPSVKLLPRLLEIMPILLFAGENDAMCAGTGIERMIEKLEWNGEVGFGNVSTLDWTVNSVLSGKWTTARGLSYVDVFHASHMVPIDVPVAAHDMLLRFMGVDTLHAAGPAAKVPSRLGQETEAVLGATQPDGQTLKVNEDAAAEANGDKLPLKDVTHDGFDKEHELMYGPRRTAVLFLFLTVFGVGIYLFFRWRSGRRKERYRKRKGKGRAGDIRLGEEVRSGRETRASRKEVPYHAPEPLETAAVFDIGEEDEFEDEAEEESYGDLGSSPNWEPDRKGGMGV
ncbi:hypothetical protein P7C70_g2025, partial [Phenoliferia sp. Uapishka_3]